MNTRAASSLVLLWSIAGCGPEPREDQQTGEITEEDFIEARRRLPEPALAQLDSGNAAFREKDYPEALRHYRGAAELAPEAPAPWFGIYMAERAVGNFTAADSAMDRAESLAADATLVHPEPEDSQ